MRAGLGQDVSAPIGPSSVVQNRTVQFGLVWFGLVRFGLVRFGSVRFGSIRFGSVRFGLVRFGLVRLGSIWLCTAEDDPIVAKTSCQFEQDIYHVIGSRIRLPCHILMW